MRRLLVAGALLGFCLGCTTVAKQAYYTATGPQGSVLMIMMSSPGEFARFKSLEIARFNNDIPASVGQFLVTTVQDEAVKEMQKSRYFESVTAVPDFVKGKAAAPTLVLRGTILDVTSDKIPGQRLLDSNYLLAVVEVLDKETGKVLAKANLRGVVKSVADSGETPLAEGMGRAVKKLFKQLTGKPEAED